MKNTTNYNLKKPEGTNYYNVNDFNDNMDVIDTELKKNSNHTTNKNNPHSVTKAQVGLGNVDNTSDSNKPVSAAQTTAINKAEKNAKDYADTAIENAICQPEQYKNLGTSSKRFDKAYIDEIIGNLTGGVNVQNVNTIDTNLDDYKTPGIYYFSSSYTPTNIPIGVNGMLIVIIHNKLMKQIWMRQGTTNSNDHHTYIRSNLGSSWSTWRKFITDKDIASTSSDGLMSSEDKVKLDNEVATKDEIIGENLLPYPYKQALPHTNRGITFEDYDGKGGIVANGTVDTTNQPYFLCSEKTILLKANQPYSFASNCDNDYGFAVIWFKNNGVETNLTYTEIRNGVEKTVTSNYCSENKGGIIYDGVTIIPSQDTYIQFDVRFDPSVGTVTNAIFHPMLEEGNVVHPWQPYNLSRQKLREDIDFASDMLSHTSDKNNPHSVTKAQVGLGNVENKSSATIRSELTKVNVTTALGYTPIAPTEKGVANGVAELDENGIVPSSQLPSYVDDVLEYPSASGFPATGESGKIYIAQDTNLTYRWGGSAYTEISKSLALGTTSSTAYRGDRGNTAYTHSQKTSGNPHAVTKSDVGLGNVDNTSDVNKPVSNAQAEAIEMAMKNAGNTQIVKTANTNLDDYKTNGKYFFSGSYTPINIPYGSNGILIVINNGNEDVIKQIWTRQGTPNSNDHMTSIRVYAADTWSNWTRFITDKDIATTSANGLMSSTDKTKIDGIDEGASNFNKNYIQTGNIPNTNIGDCDANTTKSIPITFDTPYSVTPKVFVQIMTTSNDAGYGNLTATVGDITTTGCTIKIHNKNDGTLTPNLLWFAIGKMS